jgi:phosphatidylglycerol---prolipoprotein diacylglyceryl transferase
MVMLQIPFPRIDPAAFTLPLPEIDLGFIELGPFPIRWYALGYIGGLLLGWWYAVRLATRPKLWGRDPGPLSKIDIDDFAFWVMIGILVGGRLGYILFYTLPFEPEKIGADPLFILRTWEGGMSFHGGLIGSVLAVVYTCWSRKIPLLNLADVACAAAPIGIFLVRVANFINGELYGRPTSVPWAIQFPEYDWASRQWIYERVNPGTGESYPVGSLVPVHPSQLYEALLEGVVLFAILWLAVWRFGALKRPGLVSGIFLVGYAAFRTFVENFRQPDAFVSGLPEFMTMGMLLSLPMLIGGAWLIYRSRQAERPA